MYQVLLSGDHATLPWAEAAALDDLHGGPLARQPQGRIYRTPNEGTCQRIVQRLAWGEHIASLPDAPHSLEMLADAVRAATDGEGSAAVRSLRFGDDATLTRPVLERHFGGALADAGHRIDLQAPARILYAWLGDGWIHVGWLRGERPGGYDDRSVEHRAHFHPISLHPRRAASLVHLARAPLGGRILDPFCGTGGIVLEAALLGYDAWGSDLDPVMVQGTLSTLADAASEALDATVFEADVADTPRLVGIVDAIVTDLPYGAASSTHHEPVAALYERAFAAFAALLRPGACAVVGLRDASLLALAARHGLEVAVWDGVPDQHAEYVHRSMTRHFVVLVRRP